MYATHLVWGLHVCTRFQEEPHDFDVGVSCRNGKGGVPELSQQGKKTYTKAERHTRIRQKLKRRWNKRRRSKASLMPLELHSTAKIPEKNTEDCVIK